MGKSERKSLRRKKIYVVLGVFLLMVVVTIFIINAYINRSIEVTEGTIDLPILHDEVTVLTDENGVPHIKANNEHDLYIAQGYVQAENRMFQMDLSRRQASGTLSEVVGESAIEQDKYFRTLGLRRAAEESFEIYEEESKEVLHWFADGVNAYLEEAQEGGRQPLEFIFMGEEPEEWTPIDSLTIGKFMAYDLGGHWENQAFNYYLLDTFDMEKAFELFPSYPEERPTIIKEGEIDIASSFEQVPISHPFNGSNNWVVSGDKSKSGEPLLANDPHLGLATPSIWFQMHLESTDDLNVSGVIFAGVPGIILGHNENVAWGVTNTGPDVQQLYLEERNPDNQKEFLFEDEWEEATVIEEPIEVKGQEDPINYEVTVTRHGPVISEFAEDSGEDTVLSLSWTALEPTTELEAILELNKASNWEEFETGLEKFLAPAQNFVFADKEGTIAYKANGNIPIYSDPDDALLPMEGWLEENVLDEYIPFDELPTVVNPDKGYIATANNKVVGEEFPYHLSHIWAQPYRYERIEEVLEGNDVLTIEDMQELQMDQMNLQAREFLPSFIDVLDETNLEEEGSQARDLLNEWNYVDSVDQAAPLIFQHWMMAIDKKIYEEISENMLPLFRAQSQATDTILRKKLLGEDSAWLVDYDSVEALLIDTFEEAIDELTEAYGNNPETWEWGEYHKVAFTHPLSSIHSIFEFFFNREGFHPIGGSAVTVMAASYNTETGEMDHGAPWRYVIDLENIETAYHLNGPGQSEHFRSDFYHNHFHDWIEGNFYETNLNEDAGDILEFKSE